MDLFKYFVDYCIILCRKRSLNMLKIDRQNYILEMLQEKGSILVTDACEALQCSDQTIRRDLQEMEEKGQLVRTYGGAYLSQDEDKSAPIQLREQLIPKEKERIGIIASDNFIKDGDVIMMDSSTTCYTLAKHLVKSQANVTIITNSINIIKLFGNTNQTTKLICVGGTYKERSGSFIGNNTINALSTFVADKAFISCNAISKKFGILDNYVQQQAVRKCMLEHSKEKYLLVDNTKFDDEGNFVIDSFKSLDGIITNKKPSDSWLEFFSQENISILWK